MNQNNIKPQELRATDLRIGNWIADHNEEKRFFKVEQITYSDKSNVYYIHYNNGCTKCQVKYLDPIPLSEEVLLKCGFEKYQWQNAMYIKTVFGHLYLHFYKDRIITSFKSITYDYEGQKMKSLGFIGRKESVENIIYLHQLQNLFYSLTGEELEVRWT